MGTVVPKPASGERVLGMLPLPVRIWSRARAPPCSEWSEALSAHWDTAHKGSSALRVGLFRACLDEAGYAPGITSLTLLENIEKFCD
eukprot:2848320-Pyramimonas_sp.AAC.1